MLKSPGATIGESDGDNTRPGPLPLLAHLKAPHPQPGALFGYTLTMNPTGLAVTAPYEDVTNPSTGLVAESAGAVYVFDPGRPDQPPVLFAAPNADPRDGIITISGVDGGANGKDVGSLHVDLNDRWLVVGVMGEDSALEPDANDPTGAMADNAAENAGAVYVYDRGSPDSLPQYIKCPSPASGDSFGASVSLSGTLLAVSAPGKTSIDPKNPLDTSARLGGAVFVYVWNGLAFVLRDRIDPPIPHAGDVFGVSVAIDGDLLVVGAPAEDGGSTGINGNAYDLTASASGAAYVFRRTATRWIQEAYVKPTVSTVQGFFGNSLALSGSRFVVGAPGVAPCEVDSTPAKPCGTAYVVNETTQGAWAIEPLNSPTVRDALFGWGVAALDDRMAVGSPYEGSSLPNGETEPAGATYSYEHDSAGVSAGPHLSGPKVGDPGLFGWAVGIAPGLMAVGAPCESIGESVPAATTSVHPCPSRAGAVYLYSWPDPSPPSGSP